MATAEEGDAGTPPTSFPLVRVEQAGLGPDSQVRLVVSGVSDAVGLQRAWAASGATVQAQGQRVRATTTVQGLDRAANRALPPREAELLGGSLRGAVDACLGPAPGVELPDGRLLSLGARPVIAGIVNVTDDSFSDGGALYPQGHPEAGVAHGRALAAAGADVLDVGGESSRPGAAPVPEEEELTRVVPVVRALAAGGLVCSVDTTKAAVARQAVGEGAAVVNDVSGARVPELLEVVASTGAAYVLMHTRGTPADMAGRTGYDDVVAEVYEFLAEGLERCTAAGVERSRVLVDPGIGFAKDAGQSLALLRSLRQLRGLGRPVLVGLSRKSFLGKVTARPDGAVPGAGDRLAASLAGAALAVAEGAAVVRVHDVADSVRAARLARAVATGDTDWPPVILPRDSSRP